MKTMSQTILICSLATVLGVACSNVTKPGDTEPTGTAVVITQPDPNPIDHPPVQLPPESRNTKRLTIDMLDESLPVVLGNDADGQPMQWSTKTANGSVNLFVPGALGKTLGKADYTEITAENTEPNTLYLKFMDDMARSVCLKAVMADAANPDQSTRTLARFVAMDTTTDTANINQNLRYLKLRFHGKYVPEGDDAGVADLKALFDAAAAGVQTQQAAEGWRTVCVGLMLSPEFHIY